MANHGVVTYGPDLLTAFLRMETTEHFARVSLVTELLGKQNAAFGARCRKTGHGAHPLRRGRNRRRPTAIAVRNRSEAAERTERITLSTAELEALIDEAIQQDRARANVEPAATLSETSGARP